MNEEHRHEQNGEESGERSEERSENFSGAEGTESGANDPSEEVVQEHPDGEEEDVPAPHHFRKVNLLLTTVLLTIAITAILLGRLIGGELQARQAGSGDIPPPLPLDTIHAMTYRDQLRWGDNIGEVLSRNFTDGREIELLLPILGRMTDLRRIPVGTQMTIKRDELGLRSLVVRLPKQQEVYRIERTGRLLYTAERDTIPIDTLLARYHGTVTYSFYDSFLKAGGSAGLAVKFIEVFQFVYYFSSETRVGDSYSFIVEELWQEGKRIGYGDILAAEYINSQDTLTAVWLPMNGSEFGGEHFDRQGRSLRRNLLRVPFSAARVTSTYGFRKHPISGKIRFHAGVDLAADMGTPIVAAGSGVITRMGRNHPGYGNWIHIKHDRTGFETRYGHMKGFARGIRKGLRVKQGQVIGYVGMTGHATGPHLHYEVFRDSRRLNPLSVKGSPVKRLKGEALAEFLRNRFQPWSLALNTRGMLPGRQYQGPLPNDIDTLFAGPQEQEAKPDSSDAREELGTSEETVAGKRG